MATSADRDEHDKHDEHDEDEEHATDEAARDKADEAEEPSPKKKAAAKPADRKSAKAESDHDDDDDDGDDEDEDEDDKADDEDEEAGEDDEPAPKPAKSASQRAGSKGRGPGASRAKKGAPPAQSGSLGKSVLLFFVIVIGLGAGFAILGREQPPEAARPKWSVGQTTDVEITLVKSDRQDLACASTEEIGGKHCAFEAANKPWSKGSSADDKTLLKPYTTTDRVQFTAAGLWAEPALAPDKLPATRFSVKCKFKVEGTHKNVGVRWEQTGAWYPQEGWYAGSVSNCVVAN